MAYKRVDDLLPKRGEYFIHKDEARAQFIAMSSDKENIQSHIQMLKIGRAIAFFMTVNNLPFLDFELTNGKLWVHIHYHDNLGPDQFMRLMIAVRCFAIGFASNS